MYHVILARGVFTVSVFACVYAMFGWATGVDIWLAPTQWMLVALFLIISAVYIRISEADDTEELSKRTKTVKKNGKKKNGKKNDKNQKHKSFVLSEE